MKIELRRFSRQSRFPYLYVAGIAVGGYLYYKANEQEVPISGRKRMITYNANSERHLAESSFKQVWSKFGGSVLPNFHPTSQWVNKVLRQIVKANNLEGNWQAFVVQNPTANAFSIAGGKIFVFSGALPACGNEDGLAVLLGHEMAHVYAKHHVELMSRNLFLKVFRFLALITLDIPFLPSSLISKYLLELPYSRKMEREADYIGLMFAAKACYNPKEAISYWNRMATLKKNDPPDVFSTHPSDSKRAAYLKEIMHKAEEQASDCHKYMKWIFN